MTDLDHIQSAKVKQRGDNFQNELVLHCDVDVKPLCAWHLEALLTQEFGEIVLTTIVRECVHILLPVG